MTDTYVRLVPLPVKVEGVTLPNDDGSFDIYINARLSPARQQQTLEHELRHIRRDHFYLDMPVSRMERHPLARQSLRPARRRPGENLM